MRQPTAVLHILLILLVNQLTFLGSRPEIISDEVVLNFPDSIVFNLQLQSDIEIDKITLLYSSDRRTCHAGQAKKDIQFSPAKQLEVDWEWDFTRNGTIPPGANIEWQWEITDSSGNITLTEPKQVQLQDQRYNWQQLSSNGITVQWYFGDESFGREVYDIAFNGREHVIELLGINFDEDIWITIYPAPEDVQQAIKFSSEWTGGTAFNDHNAMIIAGAPGESETINQVIPHELAHLIQNSYTFNCKGNWVPTWFGEGLAQFMEEGIDDEDLDWIWYLELAGYTPSLRSLVGSFSFDTEQAYSEYMISKLVFNFLVEEYGSQKMAELLDQLRAGEMIDSALEEVYGFDTDGLDAAWRQAYGFAEGRNNSSSNAEESTATPIPTLALYTLAVQPSPSPTSTLQPAQQPNKAVRTLPPGAETLAPGSPVVETPAKDQPGTGKIMIWVVPVTVLVVLVISGTFIFISRRVQR